MAAQILALDDQGPYRCARVLVGPAAEIVKEYYLSAAARPRPPSRLMFIGSAEGGVEIEQVAVENPEAIVRTSTRTRCSGCPTTQARELAFRIGLRRALEGRARRSRRACSATMIANDADLVEINPLAVIREHTAGGAPVEQLVCLDAKINLDDNGASGIRATRRCATSRRRIPPSSRARLGLIVRQARGNVGCLVNGAGLAMATMDLVKYYGGEPANFLDIGGSSNPEKVATRLRIILADANVKAILFNIFGGITRCDDVASGIIDGHRAHMEIACRSWCG